MCINESPPDHAVAADLEVLSSEGPYHHEEHEAYRLFITPDDPSVVALAEQLADRRNIYQAAAQWIYVSEQQLNGMDDKWQYPSEFLGFTPHSRTNPVPGSVAGDCEEQANTLASLLRASGIPADEVRVVLGNVTADDEYIRGHVWVEIYENGTWLALDPSQGPVWNERYNRLIEMHGLPFDYYLHHNYPVSDISFYYNDTYYLNARNGEGNAPNSWYPAVNDR